MILRRSIIPVLAAALWACNPVKHVPDGEYLLDNVTISVDSAARRDVDATELYNFLRQAPNHKVLGFAKLQLGTYSMSGTDSTKWLNRWLRRLGQPPVIYSPDLTDLSRRQLTQALINRGYMDATVSVDTVGNAAKKRMDVTYNITAGEPHTISRIDFDCADADIATLVLADTAATLIRPGDMFDRNKLDEERGRITAALRNNGYYAFNREYITYLADTIAGSNEIALTLSVQPPRALQGEATSGTHTRYAINNVYFVTDYNPTSTGLGYDFVGCDSLAYKDITVLYGADRYIKPDILEEKCHIKPGMPYNADDVERTYEGLSTLSILKFINIEMRPVAAVGNDTYLDAYVLLSRNKKQNVSVEVEGTNSEGDLGFGVGLTYQHRNLAKRSNLLTAKLRGSYESLSGNFDDLINNRYTEFAGEVGITFPKFEAPFLSKSFKQRIKASTEFTVSTNYQERPEYTRVIAGTGWKYKWSNQHAAFTERRTFDLIDINYVYLPNSTINFIDEIAPTNPLLRYSYEDHFIMRMGFTYQRSNRRIPTATNNSFTMQPSITTFRASAEMAGNLLYGISSLIGQGKSDGAYKIFGIQYAQYVKGEVDYTYVRNLNSRNALAMRTSFGLGYPYGNSTAIPFEKRFYAGGANGVRGWGVRTLGPGSYDSQNSVVDFINQCGDISLILSLEYRAKLFWVFEGALFVDAGNIWTIKDYENQPGGVFRFNKFYKEIAASYGAGLRMDFTYFLLRFDLGMKAHNPATNQEPWPLIHPRWGRDATFHFAVGYPF
jgi:outer membrane protein assembly factor BamA